MPEGQYVTISIEEAVATVTVNNPPANVLSTPVMTELDAALEQISSNGKLKAAVITGAGTFFIAGADIKEIASLKSAADGEKATALGQNVFNKISSMPFPVIAAINGLCLGGGMELVLSCHLRVASDRARFAQPEINLGIIPGFGGTQRLPRLVGASRALEICLTGDMITAQTAYAIGLVNKVVPDGEVLKQAQGLAKKIAAKGRLAVTAIVEAIREGTTKSLTEGLALESKLFGKICQTQDMQEGLKAFIEKRQPKFQDQ